MKKLTTKKELAMLYSPDYNMTAALNRLARWINGDQELLSALEQAGYHANQRILTPKQVKIIFDFIGKPEEIDEIA